MVKRKVADLSDKTLFEMGDALVAQQSQLDSLENERGEIVKGIDILKKRNEENKKLLDEVESTIDLLIKSKSDISTLNINNIEKQLHDRKEMSSARIKKTSIIKTNNNWQDYVHEYNKYVIENGLDLSFDPFTTLLGEGEYIQLNREVNEEFAKKTSISNNIDLAFLTVAIALQVTKSVLFPIISQKVGYGESFDKDERLAHNDKTIKEQERNSKNVFRDKSKEKYDEGEWTEIIYRTPIFDTTKGSPSIGINMEGGYHRIHTLAHDPILGWIFGTANILTDTVTMDTFATYQGARNPIRITPERVPLMSMFARAIVKIKEHPLNLPAAIVAEKIHLKSDEFTKAGLPVPLLEIVAPELAGNLYKKQYDALCLSRDIKIIGASAGLSMIIDMIIGLLHSVYYNSEKDGSKDMFEVRTRKILLISNTIASTSNLIYTSITKNLNNLDIGGILVSLSHLFCDISFIVNVKKEFIENKIYEKIEEEIKGVDDIQNRVFEYEYMMQKK